MRQRALVVSITVLTAWLCAGCGAPVLRITYGLPAAVPVAASSLSVAPDGVVFVPDSAQAHAAALHKRLIESLAGLTLPPGQAGPAVVQAAVTVAHNDQRGRRTVRTGMGLGEAGRKETLETLVRKVSVRVLFSIVSAKTSESLAGIELTDQYNSADDARTRGPLGLNRPDDPANIPATGQVVDELLAGCVNRFLEMIRAQEASADVPLRAMLFGPGAKGLAAARKGDYEQAYADCAAAAKASPRSAEAQWNQAVLAEKTGRLEEALSAYEAAKALTGRTDPALTAALERVHQVLLRRKLRHP
jgi:hypothetical protein